MNNNLCLLHCRQAAKQARIHRNRWKGVSTFLSIPPLFSYSLLFPSLSLPSLHLPLSIPSLLYTPFNPFPILIPFLPFPGLPLEVGPP